MNIKNILLVATISVFLPLAIEAQTPHAPADDTRKAAVPPTTEKAKDPTAAEVFEKYAAALGGHAAAKKIKNRETRGSVTLSPMGVTGTILGYSAPEAKNVTFLKINGLGDFAEGFDGTTGWSTNPLQGLRTKTGEELKRQLLTGRFDRETSLKSIYTQAEVTGRDTIEGKEAYVVKATPEGLGPDTLFFDVKTGLLLRWDTTLVSPEGRMAASTFLDDYREVDGVKIAFKSRTKLPQYDLVISLTGVKHNVEISEGIFAKPAQ
jgi:hypothetical protein